MAEKAKLNKGPYYATKILNFVGYPFEYAKVLIQLGYEPFPARPIRVFGKPVFLLPNRFQYVEHIRTVDGFCGCYRGAGIRLFGSLISDLSVGKVAKYLNMDQETEENDEEENENAKKRNFLKLLKYDICRHIVNIVVSHPFQVITIRTMAQFVGRENSYNGLASSIVEIYKQTGIFGCFSGLWPRLFGDLLTVIFVSSTNYLFRKYLVKDKSLEPYVPVTMTLIASSIMYPFQVVSICMAVNNSGLFVGSPPFMPHYRTWIDCWMNLSTHNQLKRRYTLINRYVNGQQL